MNPPKRRSMPTMAMALTIAVLALVLISAALTNRGADGEIEDQPGAQDLPSADAAGILNGATQRPASVGRVIIRKPAPRPYQVIGTHPETGEPLLANCSTCHATREPNRLTRSSADLEEFHQGLTMAHGNLSCVSCHDAAADRLRLADDQPVSYEDSMQLCGQCHGPQMRDWRHGAHGGMAGYWDLTQGDRIRNHCTACHDPHSPAIGQVLPAPGPNDRFQDAPHSAAPHQRDQNHD